MAVVKILNTGLAQDATLATCARNIWRLTSMYNVELVVNHIPGLRNVVADLLYGWQGMAIDIEKLD